MNRERVTRITCDGCRSPYDGEEPADEVPPGWIEIKAIGPWIGPFHACSPACKEKIERRYIRPERGDSTPPPGRDDDTVPDLDTETPVES